MTPRTAHVGPGEATVAAMPCTNVLGSFRPFFGCRAAAPFPAHTAHGRYEAFDEPWPLLGALQNKTGCALTGQSLKSYFAPFPLSFPPTQPIVV